MARDPDASCAVGVLRCAWMCWQHNPPPPSLYSLRVLSNGNLVVFLLQRMRGCLRGLLPWVGLQLLVYFAQRDSGIVVWDKGYFGMSRRLIQPFRGSALFFIPRERRHRYFNVT